MNKKAIIDLFSGCGGLSWGFLQNGFEIVSTIEKWNSALDTYNANFKTNVKSLDITKGEVKKDLEKRFKNKVGLIIGGFPCQGYSMAGKRDVNDPRNQLYKHTIEVIELVRPNIIVLENVKGILSFKDEKGNKIVDNIIDLLDKIGYYVKFVLLNSANFGIAQNRLRVIFVGAKKNLSSKVDLVIEKLKNFIEKEVVVREVIEDLENMSENISFSHIFAKHSLDFTNKIKNTKVGESVLSSYKDAFKRLNYDKVSPTIKENHGGVNVHPKLDRLLSPREMARIQSFDDDFVFIGNKSNILKQIGNAVPPKLSFEIAKIIKEVFRIK